MEQLTQKKYLSGITFAGLVSWAAWFLVIAKLNPFESTMVALILFFISLFVALICTFTLLGYYIRKYLNHNEIYYQHINIALRQAILLSICADVCLFLLVFDLLSWWSGLLLVLMITLVEFYTTREF